MDLSIGRRYWAVLGATIAVAMFVIGSGGAAAHPISALRGGVSSPEPSASFPVKTVTVGKNPVATLFDPKNGDLYVTNSNSSSVSVIDGATNKVTKTISVGADPTGAGYDSTNGDVYVISQTAATVTVISNSNVVVKTISVDPEPVAGLIAPSGNVYVTCRGTVVTTDGDLAVINESTNDVKELTIGKDSGAPYYDPASQDVDVPNLLSSNVSAVSSALTVTTISLGSGADPIAMAYSPTTKDMYVTLPGSLEIDAISSANKIVATISDPEKPFLPTYDSVNGDLYVPDGAWPTSGNLTIISSSNKVLETIKTSVPTDPLGFLDTTNGDYYLASSSGSELVFNSDSTPSLATTLTIGVEPTFVTFSSATHDVYILMFDGTAKAGSVHIYSSSNSLLSTVKVGDGGLTVTYDSTNGDVYVANFGTDTVSVIT